MSTVYIARPVSEVTTEDLLATIAADRNCIATFEARDAFRSRTRSDWRTFAPARPRETVTPADGGGPIHWHNFVAEGMI